MLFAQIVENGISVFREEPEGDWLPIVEVREPLAPGEEHVGPEYRLADDGETVEAVFVAMPVDPALRARGDRRARAEQVRTKARQVLTGGASWTVAERDRILAVLVLDYLDDAE